MKWIKCGNAKANIRKFKGKGVSEMTKYSTTHTEIRTETFEPIQYIVHIAGTRQRMSFNKVRELYDEAREIGVINDSDFYAWFDDCLNKELIEEV